MQEDCPKLNSLPFPAINTLKVDLLSENSTKFVSCTPNGREPVPFETEFFKGVAVLIIRTSPVDEYFKSFFMGKRQFEVQVQGKFKREPVGEIYVGAEVSSKMELGMLTRSISKAALRFCGTMVSDLHYSFGDPMSDPNYQVPHLVAPIFPTFDKVLVSQPGSLLPVMNVPFNEDLDYRKQRMKYRLTSDAKIDINNIYSFSVNTSNLNLLDWTLVGVPMVRPMDLRTFFSNASINLVGYEIPHSVVADHPNAHPKRFLNYVFSMRLTPVEPPDVVLTVMDFPVGSSDEETEDIQDDDNIVIPLPISSDTDQLSHDEQCNNDEDNSEDGDHDLDYNPDAREGELSVNRAERRNRGRLFAKLQNGSDSEAGGSKKTATKISGWFRRHMGTQIDNRTIAGEPTAHANNLDAHQQDVLESSEYTLTDYDMESSGDLRFSPACLELNDCRKDGKRRVLFFLSLCDNGFSSVEGTGLSAAISDPKYPRLRSYSEIAKLFVLSSIPRMYKNKRMTVNEKRRRQLVETYSSTVKSNNLQQITKWNQFLCNLTDADKSFLGGNLAVQHKTKSKAANGQIHQHNVDDSWEGYVAIATSRRHWAEHYIVLTKSEIAFFRSSDSKKIVHRVPLNSVASVQPMRLEEVPMSGFSFLQLETFSRVYYIMVRSDMHLNEWVQAFITLLGGQIMRSPFDSTHGTSFENPLGLSQLSEAEDELYIAKSSCWKLDKKRLFNYRRIIFNPHGLVEKWRTVSPNNLIEGILSTAFAISHFEQPVKNSNTEQQLTLLWVRFLDEISLLQTVNLSSLSESERMAFFLNLYHVMVIHGHMTIGPPPAWNYWNAFFNHITYLIGYEVVSIADVDHNLLRAAMSRPSSLSIIPVPQTQFPGTAITHRDFRLNFCVNCGSKSLPNVVPIYKPHLLDQQLDEMTMLNLAGAIEIDIQKRTVILPKISLHDFSSRRSANGGATTQECLRNVLSYVKKEDKMAILKMLSVDSGPGGLSGVRFKNPSLRCRMFQVLAGESQVLESESLDMKFL